MANVLYQHRIQLRSAFRMFDTDNNGYITSDEFSSGLKALNVLLEKPLTESQIEELMYALDKDRNGKISFDEFFSGFQVVDVTKAPEGEGAGAGGNCASAGSADGVAGATS